MFLRPETQFSAQQSLAESDPLHLLAEWTLLSSALDPPDPTRLESFLEPDVLLVLQMKNKHMGIYLPVMGALGRRGFFPHSPPAHTALTSPHTTLFTFMKLKS